MESISPSYSTALVQEQSYIRRVYNWMAAGLGLTAVVSMYILANDALVAKLLQSGGILGILFIVQLLIVFWLFPRSLSMGSGQATFMYFLYAGLNGIVLAPYLYSFTGASITSALVITGGMFGITSMYGYVTKKDLTSWGNLLFMALIGGILASIINGFFIRSSQMDWLLSLIFIGLGVGLTAYFNQVIRRQMQTGFQSEEMQTRSAINGALTLYLLFVMIFVHVLRFFGGRR